MILICFQKYLSDNPEVDIKGANVFLEHLNSSQSHVLSKTHHSHQHNIKEKSQQPVESILVCTGVYNPQNDLLFHVRKLFGTHKPTTHKPHEVARNDHKVQRGDEKDRVVLRANSESDDSQSDEYDDTEDERLIERPREQSEEFNEDELARALSNKNSFISYFEDKLNIPDHTFENLRHSVDYILKQNGRIWFAFFFLKIFVCIVLVTWNDYYFCFILFFCVIVGRLHILL